MAGKDMEQLVLRSKEKRGGVDVVFSVTIGGWDEADPSQFFQCPTQMPHDGEEPHLAGQ
jgi:hypothetical protein